jgi:hypothetical protein
MFRNDYYILGTNFYNTLLHLKFEYWMFFTEH